MSQATAVARAGARLLAAAALLASAAVFASTHRFVVVSGGSMLPALEPGDVCVVRRGAERAHAGDVVLFEKPGWPRGVLHRVVDLGPEGLRTRGDANELCDRDPVPRGAVVGEVVAVVRTGALLRSALRARRLVRQNG